MKVFLPLSILLLCAHATWASPQSDARFIAQREVDITWKGSLEDKLRAAFVVVYFRPISDLGIEITDEEAFRGLIPDEDIAPYLEEMVSRTATRYLSLLGPEQLASMAAVLHADQKATMSEVLSEAYEQKIMVASERVRQDSTNPGSNDRTGAELEKMTVQIGAFTSAMENGGAKLLAKRVALGFSPILAMEETFDVIRRIEKLPGNPVTLAALRKKGILSFANPVQRQRLILQFSAPERSGGIQFVKPPSTKESL